MFPSVFLGLPTWTVDGTHGSGGIPARTCLVLYCLQERGGSILSEPGLISLFTKEPRLLPQKRYIRGVFSVPSAEDGGARGQDLERAFVAEGKFWATNLRNQILCIALGAWKRTRPQLALPDLES